MKISIIESNNKCNINSVRKILTKQTKGASLPGVKKTRDDNGDIATRNLVKISEG